MASINKVMTEIRKLKPRSAWEKGVRKYALEILERPKDFYGGAFELTPSNYQKILLMGARDWKQYSWGGDSLVYNEDIAKRLSNKSELAKTKNGLLRPNAREDWLDTQAHALYQASNLVGKTIREIDGQMKRKGPVARRR